MGPCCGVVFRRLLITTVHGEIQLLPRRQLLRLLLGNHNISINLPSASGLLIRIGVVQHDESEMQIAHTVADFLSTLASTPLRNLFIKYR